VSVLAKELSRMAGPKSQQTVAAAVQRWEDKLRERVRIEMALKLVDDSGFGRQVERVAVVVLDGLPVSLVPHERDLTEQLAEIAGMFRPDLLNFQNAATALNQLLDRLGVVDKGWAARSSPEREKITSLIDLCGTLLKLAEGAKFTEIIKNIDGDVLGAYFPLGKTSRGGGVPVIELYWAVIGAVARAINVDVEGLTLTVLAHELAHAYSHLGADTDGNRWSDDAFCASNIFIKEGIAQYYTEKVMKWLCNRQITAPQRAYEEFLKIQGPPYHIHEEWTKDYSPESVRAAIIECRNSRITETGRFIDLMQMAKSRLQRRPREHQPA
jgi:hypothetical protein